MPTEPLQLILTVFEFSLVLVGAFLTFQLLANPAHRTRWLGPRPLPPWPVTLLEFAVFVFLIFGSGVFCQLGLHQLLKGLLSGAADREALQVCLNGIGLDGGGLAGWLLFRSMRKGWYADYGTEPPPAPPTLSLPWAQVWLYAGGTLLASLPVLIVFNAGWTFLLHKLGLPDEPQDLLAIFTQVKSPLVLGTLLVVACGLAPLYEELLFRAGLYRFCRQKLGRNWALLISGCLFGAMHQNLASFLPLSVFGIVLAVAYEATGSIRVAVVAHGLFNLNTIFILVSGLS
jgi:membrane protease YdiL (CAAX protease family)